MRILAAAAVDLARGEAMQRRQLHDPDTPVDAYLERCALKTARLFEASCLLTSRDERLGAFGLALGVAFQVADDILDCSGLTTQTGKIPGTDLRDGTPTLPLILASREDAVVREALAGGSLDGALLRVGATGALERSREVALDYARRAREHLDGAARADELEALTHLVVERSACSDPARPHLVREHGPGLHRLEADVEEVQGVPTDLNRQLLEGEIDLAPISSIEYARNADRLRLLPGLCVGSEGAVDSIQLVTRVPLQRVRTVAVTPESATSVVLTKVLLPEADHVPLGEEADATLLIGDAALKSAFEDPTPHWDLGRLWLERRGADGVRRVGRREPVRHGVAARGGAGRVRARARAEPSSSPSRRATATATRRASSPATSRSCATLRAPRARRAVHVPGDGA